MSVDLVMELWAKLPYFLTGLVVLLAIAPSWRLSRSLPLALALTALVVAIPILFRRRLRQALESSAVAIQRRWPSLDARDETKLFFDRIFAQRQRLFAAFAIHLGCWFLGAIEAWVIFALMGVPVSAVQALVIDSLVMGLRTFGFLVPAAAGVQEASYVLVCALFGLSPAMAVAVSLIRRARDLLIGVPILATWQYLETQAANGAPTADN